MGNRHKISASFVRKVQQYKSYQQKFTVYVECAFALIIYYIGEWLGQADGSRPLLGSVSQRCDIHEQHERTGTEDKDVPENQEMHTDGRNRTLQGMANQEDGLVGKHRCVRYMPH